MYSNKSDPFGDQLKITIDQYEKSLTEQKAKGKDTIPTGSLLKSLKQQLKDYINLEHNNNSPKKKSLALQNKRNSALEEIFKYYSKQHSLINGRKTFDAVVDERNQLVLGYFSKILKDYEIFFEPKKIRELFAKTAIGGLYLNLSQFSVYYMLNI